MMLLSVVCLAAGWSTHRTVTPSSLERVLGDTEGPVTLMCVVSETPTLVQPEPVVVGSPFESRRWAFAASVRAVAVDGVGAEAAMRPCRGAVRVVVRDHGPLPGTPRVGDRVLVTGWFLPTPGRMNPGRVDPRWWARGDGGRAGAIVLPDASLMELDGQSSRIADRLRAWHASLRERAMRGIGVDPTGIERPTPERALMLALTLGEREPELDALSGPITKLGLAHLLAISGFHLMIAAGAAAWLLRRVANLGGWEDALVAGAIAGYVLLVPAEAPIVRAAVMSSVLLLSRLGGRRYDAAAIACWAGVVLLAWRPVDAFALGAVLSVGVTVALLWIGPAAMHTLGVVREPVAGTPLWMRPKRPCWAAMVRRCGQACVIALVAWAVASPMVVWRTGVVSPIAAPLAVLGGPVAALLVVCGLGSVLLGLAHAGLGEACSGALDEVAGLVRAAGEFLVGVPGSTFTVHGVPWWAALGWLVAAVALLSGGLRERRRLAVCAVVWAFTGALWVGLLAGRLPPPVALRVDVLAVGDGSCWIVRSGRDAMLFDCGSMTPGMGERVAARSARALKAPSVRTAVLSHANIDHFNGLPEAAGSLGLRTLLVSRFTDRLRERGAGTPLDRALRALEQEGVSVRIARDGDTFALGNATVRVLGPPDDAEPRRENDRSLVLLIETPTEAGVRRVLLVGDAQDEAVAWLEPRLASIGEIAVMEMPHHGSVRESAASLIASASPRVLIQSTGPSRVGDDRWSKLLPDTPERWWVTARDGAVWVELRRDGSIGTGSVRTGAVDR